MIKIFMLAAAMAMFGGEAVSGPVTNVPAPGVSTTTAPIATASSDMCRTTGGAGFSNPMISLTVGLGLPDKNCVMLRDAKLLNDLGLRLEAIQLLCQDPKIYDAMKKAGTPCEIQVAPKS
jgi:hypothetical protein